MTDSKIKIKPSAKKREDRFAITKVTFDPLQVEIKTTDTVVLLLKSDEEQVVLRAVAALDKFVSKSADNLQSLYEMTSIMDTLLPLTSHSQLYIRRFSLKILAQMCALKPAREKLLEDLEHLPYFVQVLTKVTASLRELTVLRAGGHQGNSLFARTYLYFVQVLTKVLTKVTASLQELTILRAGAHQGKQPLCKNLTYFVQVLTKDDDHFMQEYSSLILAELTSHNIACARIVETNVLDTLFDRIASKDPDIQKNSIQQIIPHFSEVEIRKLRNHLFWTRSLKGPLHVQVHRAVTPVRSDFTVAVDFEDIHTGGGVPGECRNEEHAYCGMQHFPQNHTFEAKENRLLYVQYFNGVGSVRHLAFHAPDLPVCGELSNDG
uniref:Uncharacterized protein n=1 Tax=Timema bartmani TaxID=61472 RepID=A0A7R9I475_9NEOP|nr:unnamed protein product [Timema bartmani]